MTHTYRYTQIHMYKMSSRLVKKKRGEGGGGGGNGNRGGAIVSKSDGSMRWKSVKNEKWWKRMPIVPPFLAHPGNVQCPEKTLLGRLLEQSPLHI